MAGVGPGDLDERCLALLEAAVEALDSIPGFTGLDTLKGAPARQFVSPGRPAADCEQVCVHASLIAEDAMQPTGTGAGTRHKQEFRVNVPTYVVTVHRCLPTPGPNMNPPSRDDLEAAAAQTNADVWALWNHLWNLAREGQLFGGKCRLIYMDRAQALEPSGGIGGWTLTIRAQTEGYEETIGA